MIRACATGFVRLTLCGLSAGLLAGAECVPRAADPESTGGAGDTVGGITLDVWNAETDAVNGGGGQTVETGGGGTVAPLVTRTYTIEPDDYSSGTDLTIAHPKVTFRTTLDDNQPVELFYVTATVDEQGLAPTGAQVFAHFNIPFFNDVRRFRADFTSRAREVRLLFAGGTFESTEIGRMRAYDAAGALLAEYVTAPRGPGETEEMVIARDAADIAIIIAFVAEGQGSFGRFDRLVFTVDE